MATAANVVSSGGSRGIGALFNDRKISTKIMFGFACVLVITALISGMAYSAFGKVTAGFEAYRQRVQVVGIARDVDREFVSLRRHVGEYWLTGDKDSVSHATETVKMLNRSIADGLKVIKNPERLAKMELIRDQVGTYLKHFDALVPMKREQTTLTTEVLDPSGIKMRTDLEQLQRWAVSKAGNSNAAVLAGEALKHLMIARLSVNKLLGRHEPAAAKAAENAFKDMRAALDAIDAAIANTEVRQLLGEVTALSSKYHDAYVKAAENSHKIEALLSDVMVELGASISAEAAAIKESGIADEHAIERDTETLISGTESLVLTLSLGGLFLGVALAWLIGRGISNPIRKIGEVLLALADGNKTVEVPYAERGDEVGDNARAAKIFKDKLLEVEKLEAEQKEAEQRAVEERAIAMHKLADQFESAVGSIVGTVSSAATELEAASTTLSHTAETTMSLSTAAAAASEQASSNVQSVASAGNEMASSVNEISRQVQESTRIATSAVKQAEETDVRITELSHAASRIGDVVKLITAIAEQTNLLALNATIEAARAGEAGKGFAVVAQEVKALAAQTGKATGEIASQISSMQSATQESVAAIKVIGSTISRISEIASVIAAAVEEQGAATQEVARNIQQASAGTTQVARNITDVSRGASETQAASEQVRSSAGMLAGEGTKLEAEVKKFLSSVRTGPANRRVADDPNYKGPELHLQRHVA